MAPSETENSKEIFSFHLIQLSLLNAIWFLLWSVFKTKPPGLNHSESLLTMNLGEPILSPTRLNFKTVAFFGWWKEESFLDQFLAVPAHQRFKNGWHVRMKLYRCWGGIAELKNVTVQANEAVTDGPVVAVTLARLNLAQTLRFIKWGKPVEKQVRDHKGQTLALAATRPFNTFSTFSIWKNEAEMINMVQGREKTIDGERHKLAMRERVRKDFHYEFMTMRFAPFKESGARNGKS